MARRLMKKGEKDPSAATMVDKVDDANEGVVRSFDAAPPVGVRKSSGIDVPDLSDGFNRVTDRIFARASDPIEAYEQLEAALSLSAALTPREIEAAVNLAHDRAYTAHALYVTARAEAETFDAEMASVVSAMKEEARIELEDDKAAKRRTKSITEADVETLASEKHPEEWQAYKRRTARARAMVDNLYRLANLWQDRASALQALLRSGVRS